MTWFDDCFAGSTSEEDKATPSTNKNIKDDTGGMATSNEEQEVHNSDDAKLPDAKEPSLQNAEVVSGTKAALASQIVAASAEQSNANELINKNLKVITSVTNATSSGLLQIAREADKLNRLTRNLRWLLKGAHPSGETAAHQAGIQPQTAKTGVREDGSLMPYPDA